jgi:outer membrane lipoprotein-sorting protein
MKTFLIFILIFNGLIFSQNKDPDLILKKVKEEFNKVKDYQVDVKIKMDVDFIKVPETKAKIYFKQPDKIHFDSEGFAMLPKEGMNFSSLSFLNKNYTALFEKEEDLDGHKVSVIKVIPSSEKGDIVLTTLWVDQNENIIRKVESTTKSNGTFTIELKYEEGEKDYYLPKLMIFGFNTDKMNIPRAFSGETETDSRKNMGKTTTGKVYITYSNYSINKGISEKIFEKKKK